MSWKLVRRIVGGLFGLSLVAMAAAAATADSDKGVRSDGIARATRVGRMCRATRRAARRRTTRATTPVPTRRPHEAKQAASSGGTAEDTAANPDA